MQVLLSDDLFMHTLIYNVYISCEKLSKMNAAFSDVVAFLGRGVLCLCTLSVFNRHFP